MKKGSFFIVVLFAVSFLVPLSGAYSSYDVIAEADFPTDRVKYEALDKENLSIDKQNLAGIILNCFSPFPFLRNNFGEPFLNLSLTPSGVLQVSLILRC